MGIIRQLFGFNTPEKTLQKPRSRELDIRRREADMPGTITAEETRRHDRSMEMLKEATQLKKTNLPAAAEKVREAIRECPFKNLDYYFKLANYLAADGQFNEAFAVLRKLMTEESPSNYFMFNFNMRDIEEAMGHVVFREKRWTHYAWHASASVYRNLVALAAQGRFNGIDAPAWNNPLGERNGKKVFKELGIPEKLDDFNQAFRALLLSAEPKLKRLSELAPACNDKKPFGEDYKELFDELNSGHFDFEYQSKLQPILDQGNTRSRRKSHTVTR